MSTPSRELLDLSPKLIFDLACKMNPPHIVAVEHGLDPKWLSDFIEMPHVKRAIKEKERELEEAGYSLAAKSKLMLEDVLPDIYRRMKDPGTSLSSMLDGAKFLRQMSGLDKQDLTPKAGEKFAINIIFGGAPGKQATIDVVDVTPRADVQSEGPGEVDTPELPLATPSFLTVTVATNDDLHYNDSN